MPTMIHDEITHTGILGEGAGHTTPSLHWTDFGNWWRFQGLQGYYLLLDIGTMRVFLSITSIQEALRASIH